MLQINIGTGIKQRFFEEDHSINAYVCRDHSMLTAARKTLSVRYRTLCKLTSFIDYRLDKVKVSKWHYIHRLFIRFDRFGLNYINNCARVEVDAVKWVKSICDIFWDNYGPLRMFFVGWINAECLWRPSINGCQNIWWSRWSALTSHCINLTIGGAHAPMSIYCQCSSWKRRHQIDLAVPRFSWHRWFWWCAHYSIIICPPPERWSRYLAIIH